MAEKYVLALMFAFALMTLLVILGMPSDYQLVNGFDFAWFGGGVVAITTGCVVLTGIPCAVLEASYGALTILGYFGLGGFLTTGTVGTVAVIKALVMTPLSILLIYVISKLARGGG